MWKLKDNVIIVDRKNNLYITEQLLAKNQGLAEIVMQSAELNAKWGHNFIQVGEPKSKVKDELTIEVNVKKKPESVGSASTLTGVSTGGQTSTASEEKQELKSQDSQPLNRSQRRAISKGQSSGASVATGK